MLRANEPYGVQPWGGSSGRQAYTSGDSEAVRTVSVNYGILLSKQAVPVWQETLDALQKLPEIGTVAPIGYGGGISLGTAIGIQLTAADPRISAAIFGGGFVVYADLIERA